MKTPCSQALSLLPFFFLVILQLCCSYSQATAADSYWQVSTASKTRHGADVMPFSPHRANSGSLEVFKADSFDDAGVCAKCHGDIYQQWRSSTMGHGWKDPLYRALLKRASEATDGAFDFFCAGCHSPIGLVTGQITSTLTRMLPGSLQKNKIPDIDCEACHNMSGRTGLDNGAYELTIAAEGRPVKFGPRKDGFSPYHETAYSEFHTRSDFCAPCHNVTHPFSMVPIERTYDEWQVSDSAKAGVGCQDCHMQPFKGKAASMGPPRDDIASHSFIGGNSSLLNHLGAKDAAVKTRQMLQAAASIRFTKIPQKIIPGVINQVELEIKNIGAGHKLPTGFPEGREIWIDFSITDATGTEIYRSGKITAGKTEPNTRNFKMHLGNSNGEEVDLEIWTVTHIISDTRIPNQGTSSAKYDILIPTVAKPPYTITATLRYWPFSQAFADLLLGPKVMKVDIVDMAMISQIVY